MDEEEIPEIGNENDHSFIVEIPEGLCDKRIDLPSLEELDQNARDIQKKKPKRGKDEEFQFNMELCQSSMFHCVKKKCTNK